MDPLHFISPPPTSSLRHSLPSSALPFPFLLTVPPFHGFFYRPQTCFLLSPLFLSSSTSPSQIKASPLPFQAPPYPLSLKRSHPPTFIPCSIDVSKEDTPTSGSEQPDSPSSSSSSSPPSPDSENFDKRRLEEKFAVLNTGIYECRSCGYKYDVGLGDPSYPIPPGFQFERLPDDWRCPTCGAAKSFFESKSVEIAGFAQNQNFGLGGNSLTSGQKAVLIYGSLFFFFVLFLSGYFIQ